MRLPRICIALLAGLLGCGGPQTPSAQPVSARPASSPLIAACDAGTVNSCLVAGNDAETAGDLSTAAVRYNKACELGDASGCALAGGALAELRDFAAATTAFEAGCALGDGTACYGAGLVAIGVFGGEPAFTRAAASFEKGCSAGLPDACGELANLLGTGQGVPLDLERAAAMREQACEQGHGGSCTRLGLEAWRNQSDEAGARALFEKACGLKVPDADGCGWLGWTLWSGIGGDADEGRGVALLDASCESDSAIGCAMRAIVHAKNGEADLAAPLMQKACELDPSQCDTMRKSLDAAKSGADAAP